MAIYRSVWIALALMLVLSITASAEVNMEFKSADIRDVLQVLGEIGGMNIVIDEHVRGEVTLQLKDIGVLAAIDLVTAVGGYGSATVNNTLIVAPRERLHTHFTPFSVRFFPLTHIDPSEVVPSLTIMLGNAEVVADSSGNGVIVRGSHEQLENARVLIQQRDIPTPFQFDFVETDVLSIFRTLAKAGGYTLIVGTEISKKLTFFYHGTDVSDAIALVSEQSGVNVRFDGNRMYVIAPTASISPPLVTGEPAPGSVHDPTERVHVFHLDHIRPEQAKEAISLIVPDQNTRIDDNLSALIVTGSMSQLDSVSSILSEYDIPRLSVHGIVIQGDKTIVMLAYDDETIVVSEGDRAGIYVVESISPEQITLVDAQGRRRIVGRKGLIR